MEENLSLEDIASNNDVVLLDTNPLILASRLLKKAERCDKKGETILDGFSERISWTREQIEDNSNITSIREVLSECDILNDDLYHFLLVLSQRKAHSSVNYDSKIRRCRDYAIKALKNSKALMRVLQKRVSSLKPELYFPMIALSYGAADNMHLFSSQKKHLVKNGPEEPITDELLVASAFALSANNRGSIALVSYDTRIPRLVKGIYDIILSEDIFKSHPDLADIVVDNQVRVYGAPKIITGQKRYIEKNIKIDEFNFKELDKGTQMKIKSYLSQINYHLDNQRASRKSISEFANVS